MNWQDALLLSLLVMIGLIAVYLWIVDWVGVWGQARRRLAPYRKVNDCKPGCFMITRSIK